MTSEPDSHIFMPSSDRTILQNQFLNQPPSEHPQRWEDLWKRKCTPWDRNGPSLALRDAVLTHLPSPLNPDGSRKRALVPGCGRGYDVLLLSSLGYDTFGLDASATAIEAAKKVQAETGNSELYAPASQEIGKGSVTFLLADFFKHPLEPFDLIFDYTFLCALPPELRPSWSKRLSQLLSPTGNLVCLEWPLGKPPKEGGPPHGLTSELYVQLLARPGEEVEYDESGVVVKGEEKGEGEGALVRVKHFMPERTHKAGKGKDYVSIWQHAGAR